MRRTVGVLVMEHIAVGLVEGDKVVGPLNIYPETSQTLDPLQSMPSEGIVDCIRRQVENVAGGEKIEAIGIGFPGIIRNGVIEDSPNFHQAKGFALQAALSSALTGKAEGGRGEVVAGVVVFWISNRRTFLKTPLPVTRAAPNL